jgi:hypothetical protein
VYSSLMLHSLCHYYYHYHCHLFYRHLSLDLVSEVVLERQSHILAVDKRVEREAARACWRGLWGRVHGSGGDDGGVLFATRVSLAGL